MKKDSWRKLGMDLAKAWTMKDYLRAYSEGNASEEVDPLILRARALRSQERRRRKG